LIKNLDTTEKKKEEWHFSRNLQLLGLLCQNSRSEQDQTFKKKFSNSFYAAFDTFLPGAMLFWYCCN